MEVLILQVFVSLVLVTGSLLLFVNSVRRRDYDHADRLALFPIADDDARPNGSPCNAQRSTRVGVGTPTASPAGPGRRVPPP